MSVRINKLAAAVVVAFAASGANAAIQTLDGIGFDISYDDAARSLRNPQPGRQQPLLRALGFAGLLRPDRVGLDFTNSTFAFQITADPGYMLTAFTLVEEGDYFYFGDGAGVAVGGQLRVKSLVPVSATMTSAIEADTSIMNAPYRLPLTTGRRFRRSTPATSRRPT